MEHVGRDFGRSEYSGRGASVFLKVLGIISLASNALGENEGQALCNNRSDGCGRLLWERRYWKAKLVMMTGD